ncbi:MAG: phage replisome organizer N-terminal domain-containing protein [Campylobacterales bacterium]|nr:phage replisome organizer N-terminal domain-containing protein [Campylobacterales bacterium]
MSLPKKYFWLKLKDTFFSNPKIKKLRKIAGGDTFSVIYLKLMLLSLKNDGIIEIEGLEPTVEEELALVMDEEVDNVRLTISYLQQTGLLEKQLLGHILMVEVPSLIGKECESAERKRRQRQRERSLLMQNVTLSHTCPASVTTEIELEKEIEIDKDSLYSLSHKSNFKQFRQALAESKYSFSFEDGICGYLPTTMFKITNTGFIHNVTAGKDVNSEDAQKMWDYLYSNRQKIINHLEPKETINEN